MGNFDISIISQITALLHSLIGIFGIFLAFDTPWGHGYACCGLGLNYTFDTQAETYQHAQSDLGYLNYFTNYGTFTFADWNFRHFLGI